MRAPNPTTVPSGVMDGKKGKGKGKTIRFKGLTLRSKSIAAGLGESNSRCLTGLQADISGAPRLDITGQRGNKVIVGQVGSVGLDSWDIAHALSKSDSVTKANLRCPNTSIFTYSVTSCHTCPENRHCCFSMADAKPATRAAVHWPKCRRYHERYKRRRGGVY